MRLRVEVIDEDGDVIASAEVSGATFPDCMDAAGAEFLKRGTLTGIIRTEQLPDA